MVAICPKCGHEFRDTVALRRHQNNRVPCDDERRRHECGYCDARFTTRQGKSVHQKKHVESNDALKPVPDKRAAVPDELDQLTAQLKEILALARGQGAPQPPVVNKNTIVNAGTIINIDINTLVLQQTAERVGGPVFPFGQEREQVVPSDDIMRLLEREAPIGTPTSEWWMKVAYGIAQLIFANPACMENCNAYTVSPDQDVARVMGESGWCNAPVGRVLDAIAQRVYFSLMQRHGGFHEFHRDVVSASLSPDPRGGIQPEQLRNVLVDAAQVRLKAAASAVAPGGQNMSLRA